MHLTSRSSRLVGICALGFISLSACAGDSKASTAATAAGSSEQQAAAEPPVAATDAARSVSTAAAAYSEAATEASTPAIEPAGAPAADAVVALSPAQALTGIVAITATVTVEVSDVREAVVDLPGIVSQHGGVVYDTDIEVGDPASAIATMTIKVPPSEVEPLIASLGGFGRLIDRNQQTEEVGTQLADLGARIATAQASVDRVRILLEDANTLQEVTTIESELTVRETVLEQYLAQQRNLTNRVATSTVTVVLKPTPVEVVEVAPTIDFNATGRVESVGGAFQSGWRNFTKVVHNLVVFIGYTLPFAATLGLLAAALRLTVRRRPTRVSPAPSQSQ